MVETFDVPDTYVTKRYGEVEFEFRTASGKLNCASGWQKIRFILQILDGAPPDPHVSQSAPPIVLVTGTTTSTVSLAWTTHPSMEYQVFRNGSRVGSGGSSYTDSGLTPATTYSYMVREIDAYGGKVTSALVYATTLSERSGGGGGQPTNNTRQSSPHLLLSSGIVAVYTIYPNGNPYGTNQVAPGGSFYGFQPLPAAGTPLVGAPQRCS